MEVSGAIFRMVVPMEYCMRVCVWMSQITFIRIDRNDVRVDENWKFECKSVRSMRINLDEVVVRHFGLFTSLTSDSRSQQAHTRLCKSLIWSQNWMIVNRNGILTGFASGQLSKTSGRSE